MLKEIIGTILFSTFSLRATPLRAQNDYYKVQGYYCLRDELDTIDVQSLYFGDIDNPLTLYAYDLTDEKYYTYNNLVMNRTQSGNTTYYSVILNYYNVDSGTLEYTYSCSFTSLTLANESNKCKNFLMYVPSTYNISTISGNAGRFLSWFTNEGNEYMHNYTGWYYLANYGTNFDVIGSLMINNKLYGAMTSYSNGTTIYADYPKTLRPNSNIDVPIQYIYKDNAWQIKDRNIYFTGVVLNDDQYTKLSTCGSFAYIPSVAPDDYTFEDLFFNLADTPIYFIYSLFNWKLFGANLFIAFTGLVSFAILLILFRTFVWKK